MKTAYCLGAYSIFAAMNSFNVAKLMLHALVLVCLFRIFEVPLFLFRCRHCRGIALAFALVLKYLRGVCWVGLCERRGRRGEGRGEEGREGASGGGEADIGLHLFLAY